MTSSGPSIRFDVFLSSTWVDFKDVRVVITEAIQKAGYVTRGMEQFPAMSDEVFEYIKKVIDECSYYVLVSGTRYGSVSPKYKKSYTHLEFEYAKSRGIPILCFLLSDAELHKVLDKVPKELSDFRHSLTGETQIVHFFEDKNNLPYNIVAALANRDGRRPKTFWINSSDSDYQNLERLRAEGLVRFDGQSNTVDESENIRNSSTLFAQLNDGYGWVPKYRLALEQRFSNQKLSTTIILLDPEAAIIPQVAEKSNKAVNEQQQDIWSRVEMLTNGSGSEAHRAGRLHIYGSHRPLTGCYFIYDDHIVWTPYLTRYRPPQLPRIELKRSGTIAQYLLTDAEVLERELAVRDGGDLVVRFRNAKQ